MPGQEIHKVISKQGFITIDDAMEIINSSRPNSYYQTIGSIGAEGDFTTSPEVSQLFGEVIGIWCYEAWLKLGAPAKFVLIELGPGRGILMRDILKVLSKRQEMFEALEIVFLEINPKFRALQKSQISFFTNKISWIENLNELQSRFNQPALIIANEFFDALPIKQYIKLQSGAWHEITLAQNAQQDLEFSHKSEPLDNFGLEYIHAQAGSILEVSPASIRCMQFIDQYLKENRGGLLIVDYGYNLTPENRQAEEYNSSLQAIWQHQPVDVLTNLGKSDLSAHVDFHHLSQYLSSPCEIITQRQFLINYGILIRAQNLASKQEESLKIILERQLDYLINPKYMGQLFKVLISFYLGSAKIF